LSSLKLRQKPKVFIDLCTHRHAPQRPAPSGTHGLPLRTTPEAMEQAWAPPPYEPERGFTVYAASKAQSEKELWKLYNEMEKPSFVLNTGMSPNTPFWGFDVTDIRKFSQV
jgi:hypothetical protein